MNDTTQEELPPLPDECDDMKSVMAAILRGSENQKGREMMLSAFHNDPAIKAKYLARVREHARLDHLVQGTGWKNGKGCAVGCTLESYHHSRYPIELGIPVWLAHLEDQIFEKLPWDEARSWPERFLVAIPVGADLEPVQWQQAIWRHERQLDALKDNAEPYATQVRDAIRLVIDYCRARLEGAATEKQRNAESGAGAWSAADLAWSAADLAWSAARSARSMARSMARSAARSAQSAARSAEAAAESGAEAAARSAAWSAEAAAESAAESEAAAESAAESEAAAESAAESEAAGERAHWRAEAEHLLMLLANAKVPA
jgi:hypothetical protein